MKLLNIKWSSLLLGSALLLSVTGAAGAQESAKPGAAKPASSASTKRDAGGGMAEKLKVHGNWTIVVRNADGSVASRHQFNNALTVQGATFLVGVLGRQHAPGFYAVVLNRTSLASSPCLDGAGALGPCVIHEAGQGPPGPLFSVDLVVSAPATGPEANMLVMMGTIKTINAGHIAQVSTLVYYANMLRGPEVLTEHTLPTPIPVQANQTIDVTVVISFS